MPNTITELFQQKVVPGLYTQFHQGSTTAWMENNAVGVDYHGGKYVIMHEMEVEGLGSYDRNLGYPRGVITGSKKQYEMTMDRGREFLIDAADNDETGFLLSVANAMMIFQRDHVIPEVDCYRYSKIYKEVNTNASSNVISTAIKAANITEMLSDDITTLQDKIGTDVPLVIVMSGLTQKYLGREFIHNLDYQSFQSGNLQTKVKSLDGHAFMIVPSARLKTQYDFMDGVTSGQEKGGFKANSGAKDMKWIIMPQVAPIAVAKIDKQRVFTPDEYQQAHAWKTDYRMYHDLWMTPKGYNNTIIRTGDITE